VQDRALEAVIRSAELIDRPWPHIEIDGFLSTAQAERIARDWPVDGWSAIEHSDAYRPDGTSRRQYQPVAEAFPDIADELLSDAVQTALVEKLDVTPQPLYPVALLIEDAPGYWIRLHPDSGGKVVTCQVYLPTEGGKENQGVVLQDRSGSVTKQIPYTFNRAYAFKVTKGSWHRVRRCEGPRRSIQLIYYSTPNPKM
jgi:hypothetical protein